MKEAAAGKEGKENGYLGDMWRSEDAIKDHEEQIDEGIGLFFVFSAAAALLLSLSLFFVLYLIYPRLAEIHLLFPAVMTWLLGGILLLVAGGLFMTFLTVLTGKSFFPRFLSVAGKDKGLIMLLTPLAVKTGGWLGVSRDRVASSFIKVNNALVVASRKSGGTNSILILLPRCIQHSKCKQKVEIDIANCKDCGLCDIADIIRICEDNNVDAFVATGGNIARKLIKDKRPAGVIGVACERELLSGIHDTSGLPVIGIPNIRPEGPCIDTRVELSRMEEAIKAFIN